MRKRNYKNEMRKRRKRRKLEQKDVGKKFKEKNNDN